MDKIKLVEIFHSIQGEGYNFGKPINFIRFTNCNLNCPWCDTEWSKWEYELTIEEIMKMLKEDKELSKTKNLILTGGEPTIHPLFEDFVEALKKEDYSIHIETNGLTDVKDEEIWISTSPKVIYAARYKDDLLSRANEIRVVIDPFASLEQHISFIGDLVKRVKYDYFYLSPCEVDGKFDFFKLGEVYQLLLKGDLFEGKQKPMVSIQLHKLMEIR